MGGDTSVKTDIGQIYFYTKKLYIFDYIILYFLI
jgi:hypothetical protein